MDTLMQKPWTKEEIEIVSQLAGQGMSAAEIGLIVGRTRNSVIGAAYRNKLQLLAKKEHIPKERKPRPPRGNHLRRVFMSTSTPKEPKHETPPPPPPSRESYVPFLERRSGQCKFIVEKRNETHICCGATATRNGWCDYHASIVYRPPDQQPTFRDGGGHKHKKIHGPSE